MAPTRETLAGRIRDAVARKGMTQQELAQRVNLDPTALSKALSGKRDFKSLELALIAEALDVRTQDLLANDPVPEVTLAARRQTGANPVMESALRQVDEILDLNRLLSDLGYESPATDIAGAVGDEPPYVQGERLANWLREKIGLPEEDLPYEIFNFAKLLESELGIDIAFIPLEPGLDGLSISCGQFKLALVNSKSSATRQRFTLAHELGHLVAGDASQLRIDENVLGGKSPGEQRANAFAAAFLMPERSLRTSVPKGYISEANVADLLTRYAVSLDALAYRLHNRDLISAETRDRIRSMSSSQISLRQGRSTDLQTRNYRRAPGNLLFRTMEAYVAGQISIRPLSTLLDVDPYLLLEELSPTTDPDMIL
ncbi:helix-turn-helix domain-containing protein [Acrocarpospora macrocephala]|uniref:helix-turn-helix domain-containing protein n=1 Tax=Acrocarpospora macrocephala TaxID=150177 RepID=UPI002484671A